MKSFLHIVTIAGIGATAALAGLTSSHAQDRGGWEFFNFREVQEETPDTRQTQLPDFSSDQGRGGSSQFDVLVAQCAAIEGQFGRACDAEKVKEILATSMIFEGDAIRASSTLPQDGDVVTAANEVFKDSTSDDLKAYAWGLLFESAAYSKGDMHRLMKDSKIARMSNFTKALQDSMKLMEAQKKWMETGRSTAPVGESADDADTAAKKYGYDSGDKSHVIGSSVVKSDSMSSCLKTIKWQLPKAGGGFGPMSAAGDINPDTGGGAPAGPDGKPMNPAGKLEGKDIDCTMFDPNMGKKQVGQDQASNEQQKQGTAASTESEKDAQGKTKTGTAVVNGTATKKEGGSSTDEHTVSGKIEQKTGSDGKVSYVIKATVTNEKTGEESKVQQNLPANADGGPPKFFTTGEKYGQGWEISIDKMSGQTGGMVGMKPKGNAGFADPNADVSMASNKSKCENAANNAFKDCLFGALAQEFEKDQEQQHCEEKGWVAGDSDTITGKVTGGKGSVDCSKWKNSTAEGLDQQLIFMKTGGGVTDPMKKQGGNNAAQPPQDGQFKQGQSPAQ